MSTGNEENSFGFSSELDTAFLKELYGDDLQQAELVFESSLQQIEMDLPVMREQFGAGDVGGLKKTVHKLKPLFGYIGLNPVQEEYSHFEAQCQTAPDAQTLHGDFKRLLESTEAAHRTIETEWMRLQKFNTQFQ